MRKDGYYWCLIDKSWNIFWWNSKTKLFYESEDISCSELDFQEIDELIIIKAPKIKKTQESIYCSDINSACDTTLLNNKLKSGFRVVMKDRIDGRKNGITGYRYILEKNE